MTTEAITIPESLQTGLTPKQELDLKIILIDRRVTDEAADFWMKESSACLSELNQAKAEIYELKGRLVNADGVLERLGYRHCDIPACNCNSYHKSK